MSEEMSLQCKGKGQQVTVVPAALGLYTMQHLWTEQAAHPMEWKKGGLLCLPAPLPSEFASRMFLQILTLKTYSCLCAQETADNLFIYY